MSEEALLDSCIGALTGASATVLIDGDEVQILVPPEGPSEDVKPVEMSLAQFTLLCFRVYHEVARAAP